MVPLYIVAATYLFLALVVAYLAWNMWVDDTETEQQQLRRLREERRTARMNNRILRHRTGTGTW